MKVLLTLDYELFLGNRTGTIDKCLTNPMKMLVAQTNRFGVKYTLFADAAYLYRLNELSNEFPSLANDFQKMKNELSALVKAGHDVQLHIHPQWYYSSFDGQRWKLDQNHYKLSDVPKEEVSFLFKNSKTLLDNIVGYETHAFRAGGFSLQPFSIFKGLFKENGLTVDSSACPGTRYESTHQCYDYTSCPKKSRYRFEDDVTMENEAGHFTEIPINMYPVSPWFYWHLAFTRLTKSNKHVKLGDGESVQTAKESILERLSKRALSLSTIDGLKISYLYDSLQEASKRGDQLFCAIGHPKLATPYSIDALGGFCYKAIKEGHEFITISQI